MLPPSYFKPLSHARQDCLYQLQRAQELVVRLNDQYDAADAGDAALTEIYVILNRLHTTEAERDALAEMLRGLEASDDHLHKLASFLVPKTAWTFRQSDFLERHCMAYSMEFALQRLSGGSVSESLAAMRFPGSHRRLIQTQSFSRGLTEFNYLRAPSWMPQTRFSVNIAKVFARHRRDMHATAGLPAWVDGGLDYKGAVQSPIGIGHVMVLWPRGVPKHEADFKPSTRGRWLKPLRRPAAGPDAETAAHTGPREAALVRRWGSSLLEMLGPALRRSARGGLFILEIRREDGGHAMVLDLSSRSPGLMDPNYGYLPLPSRSERDPTLHWLLAVMACLYETQVLQAYFIEFPPGRPRRPLPGLRADEPDAVRWHG